MEHRLDPELDREEDVPPDGWLDDYGPNQDLIPSHPWIANNKPGFSMTAWMDESVKMAEEHQEKEDVPPAWWYRMMDRYMYPYKPAREQAPVEEDEKGEEDG